MKNTLKNKPLSFFENENVKGKSGAYAGSEWTPYKLSAIREWIEIRDEYTFTADIPPRKHGGFVRQTVLLLGFRIPRTPRRLWLIICSRAASTPQTGSPLATLASVFCPFLQGFRCWNSCFQGHGCLSGTRRTVLFVNLLHTIMIYLLLFSTVVIVWLCRYLNS